ncbi:uncharacterized protein LOC127831874 [Dreissena polymorpha]|nr:uncharacterized protein LOC127831874 [Dreissena polymorpha]
MKIHMFCEDHSELICQTCISSQHRHCVKVTLTSQKGKVESCRELLSQIQKIQGELLLSLNKNENNIQSTEASHKMILQAIKDLRKNRDDSFDKLEDITKQELNGIMTSLMPSLQLNREQCIHFQTDLKCFGDTLQDVEKKSKEFLFIAQTKYLQQLKKSRTFIGDILHHNEYAMEFVPNKRIEQLLPNITCLGRIIQPNKVISMHSKIKHKLSISGIDRWSCYPYGMCEVDKLIIVVDNRNSRVKVFDELSQVVSHFDVPITPWDICMVSDREVAVTVDNNDNTHGVQFFNLVNMQLAKSNNYQLDHACHGIACHKNDLFITSNTELYHYTLDKTLILKRKLYEDTSHKHAVFKCAVSLSGNKIYVTGNSQNQLLTLTRDGSVLSTLTDPELTRPGSVHVTFAGQVLVCGISSRCIIQVDSTGRKKIATLVTRTDLDADPASVLYSRSKDSVIVGQCKNDFLLEFQIK